MGRLVGYARVSTPEQDMELQLDELRAAGCAQIFSDTSSGAKAVREGLDACLKSLEQDDVLLVWRLDRLGRSMSHLVSVIMELKDRGVGFKSLRDGVLDTTTASGELVFHIFAALAQFERGLIQERTRAGLAAARARGRLGGRKPITANHPRVRMAKRMHKNHEMSIEEICSAMGVSRATFYRYLKLEPRVTPVNREGSTRVN